MIRRKVQKGTASVSHTISSSALQDIGSQPPLADSLQSDVHRNELDSTDEELDEEEDDHEELLARDGDSSSENEIAHSEDESESDTIFPDSKHSAGTDDHRPTRWQQAQNEQKKQAATHRNILAHLYIRYEYGFTPQPCSKCSAEKASLLCKGCHRHAFFCGTCYHACHQGIASDPPMHFDGESWLPVEHFVQRDGALFPITESNRETEYKQGGTVVLTEASVPDWLLQCSTPKTQSKRITVFSFSPQPTKTVLIKYCSCPDHSLLYHLVLLGLFPLTFVEPESALSLATMDLLSKLALAHDPVRLNSLVDAMLGPTHTSASHVKNHIMLALQEFLFMKDQSRTLDNIPGKPTDTVLNVDSCPICFQRRKERVECTCWAYDGIYLPRQKDGTNPVITPGIDDVGSGLLATPTQTSRLADTASRRMEQAAAKAEFKSDGCGAERKFKAMTSLSGKRKVAYDQHGLLSAHCNHGLVQGAVVMQTAECFMYSIMLLIYLRQVHPDLSLLLLVYDVMCRAAPVLFSVLGELFIKYVALPVWHALAHVPECASKKSAALLIEPGDVNGEESERTNSWLRRAGSSLKRMTGANYWRWADRCLLSWNLLKISRINTSLHATFNKLLKKRVQVQHMLCDELVFLIDQKGYSKEQLQTHYETYRQTASDGMRAGNRPESKGESETVLDGPLSSSSRLTDNAEIKHQTKVKQKEKKEIKWFSYWREAKNLEQQLSLFASTDHLGQRERKRFETMTKDKERITSKYLKHIKWVSVSCEQPSETKLAELQTKWAKWQVLDILPAQIKNLLFRLEHAKYVSAKPLLRDVEYTHLRKQKQAKKSSTRVRVQFEKLKTLVQFFNSVFNLLPAEDKPPGMKLIDDTLSEQKQSLQVTIKKCLGESLHTDELTPYELQQFCKISDKLARINQSLENNIRDRGFYNRFLKDRITTLREVLTLPTLLAFSGGSITKRTDFYAFRAVIYHRIRDHTLSLKHCDRLLEKARTILMPTS